MTNGPALIRALLISQRFNDDTGNAANYEYVRGQAELICDMFQLGTDECRDDVMELIAKDVTRERCDCN
jgi:hypothetical protein